MKRTLLLSFLVGILSAAFFAFLFTFFDVNEMLVPGEQTGDAKVLFLGDRTGELVEVLEAEMDLRDSTPLFMPTVYNAASDLSGLRRLQDEAEAFRGYAADLLLPLEPFPEFPREPADLNLEAFVPSGTSFFLSRYKRQPFVPESPDAANRLLVVGRCLDCPQALTFRQSIEGLEAGLVPMGLWQPLVAYLHLIQGRTTGPPLLSSRSGYPDWDAHLLTLISREMSFPLFPDGYYQITIEP